MASVVDGWHCGILGVQLEIINSYLPRVAMGHVENSTIFHQKVADVPTSLGVKYGRD